MSESDRDSAPVRGLALSGGGFRASFFHIGVLARMAELDLLRGVERISTVSGGSIVGALYYLKVKNCLEESYRRGTPATAADYVQIVRDLCDEFLAGVQQDLRSRTFGHWRSNFNAESSQFIGGLYDDFFYARYRPTEAKMLTMRDLRIEGDAAAAAKESGAMAPQLFINATVLDTGQQWVFTPEGMGLLDDEDSSPTKLSLILGKRHRYENLEGHKDLPLGFAVAASACVPLLLPPIRLRLWPFDPALLDGRLSTLAAGTRAEQQDRARQNSMENIGFELVDGGVVDNLGLAALMGTEGRVLVSNASAPPKLNLSARRRTKLAVGRTSLAILMSRTQQAASLHALAQLDPRDYLEVSLAGAGKDPEAWKETGEKRLELVDLIRNVRTDLDAFSAWESHALMYSGYASARHNLKSEPVVTTGEWLFQGAKAELTLEQAQGHLSASSSHFKVVRLVSPKVRKRVLFVLLLVGVVLLMTSINSELGLLPRVVGATVVLFIFVILPILLATQLWRMLVSSVMVVSSRASLALRPLLLRSRVPWALDERRR